MRLPGVKWSVAAAVLMVLVIPAGALGGLDAATLVSVWVMFCVVEANAAMAQARWLRLMERKP